MANAIVIFTITSKDFERLVTTSMQWGKDWMKQKNRFEDAPLFTWKWAYWIDTYLETLICQHYLSANGFESQTVWDTATQQWLILSNYEGWVE